MAYIRQQFEPNQTQAMILRDFSGGINNVDEYMADNQFLDVYNMEYYDDNVLERRRGLKRDETINNHDAFIKGAQFADFYYPYNKDPVDIFSSATEYMISTNAYNTPQTHSGRIHDGINYMGNYLFLRDNSFCVIVDTSSLTYGTYVTQEGTMPSSPDGYHILQVVTPSEGYAPLDTTHTRGVIHYNWINFTVEYRPCQNELVDPYKGKNVVPTMCRYIADLKGRVYLSGVSNDDDNVFITDSGNPFYFPVGMAVQVPPDNDKIIGLTAYDDALVVFRQQDIYLLRGTTNNPTLGADLFTLQKLNTSTGLIAPKYFSKAQTYLFFVGYDFKVYALTSTNYNDKRLNVQTISKNIDLTKEPFSLTREMFNVGNALFHDNKFYIATDYRMTIYNFDHMSWYRYRMPQIWYMALHPFDRIRFVSPTCWVLRFFDKRWDEKIEYTDVGAPYTSLIKTKNYDFDNGAYLKYFKNSHVISEVIENKTLGTLTYTFDEYNTVIHDLAQYERGYFGSSNFGQSRDIKTTRFSTDPIPLRRRAKRMNFECRYGYDGFHFLRNRDIWDINTLGVGDRIWIEQERKMLEVIREGESNAYKEVTVPSYSDNFRLYQIDIEYEIKGRR